MAGNSSGVVSTTRAIYDFTPFLSAKAVRDRARSAGMITTVAIPVTPCPSPLASNITPEQLANLKNHLTGPKTNHRGKEIWESWKRAWDLWNNNYIEGRVNPEWVKMEWDRRTEEKAKREPRRRRYGRSLLTPRPEPQVLDHFVGPVPPDARPGTKWVKERNEKKIVKTGRKLTRFVKTSKTIEAQKAAKPYRLAIKKFQPFMESQEGIKESRTDPYYTIDHSWEGLENARHGSITLSRPSDSDVHSNPESRQVDRVKVTTEKVKMQLVKRMVRVPRVPNELLSWSDLSQARLNNSAVTNPTDEPNVIYDVVEKDIWEPVGQMVDSDEYKYIQSTEPGQATKLLEPTVLIVDEEEEFSEVEEQTTSYWELVDYFDDPRPRPKNSKKQVDPKDSIASPPMEPVDDVAGDANDKMDDQDDFMVIDDMSDDDDEDDDDWWIPKIQDANGSSGGFFAIKDREEFRETPDEPWNDIINNTVWRPRRVGEKALRIDEDEDEDDFLDGNDLTVDGGVDCGRRPFPVLRSIDNYYSVTKMGLPEVFKKRKVWDGVTGTIFNLPTQPLESDDESEDERHILVRAMYSENLLSDPSAHQTDLFPLDIRRVNRQDTQACRIIEVDENEMLVRYSWENPLKDYRYMAEDDPWFVTTEQEELRDVPPRRYPPAQPTYDGNRLIPTDDVNWIENRVMDEMGDSQYFVTNLHGGTLIINGQEVKKGQVAGPLPPFAVIESPGGQVSFWWGTRGRHWNQASRPAPDREWEALRQVAGWEHVGLKAGVVWDWKIKDRMKREENGEDEDDDELWKNWKNPKSDEPDFEAMTDAEYGAYYGTQFNTDDYLVANDYGGDDIGPHKEIPPPEIFESEEAELKWISFTAGRLQRLGEEVTTNNIVEPSGENFWSGPEKEDRRPRRITEAKLEEEWKKVERGRSQFQGAAFNVTNAKWEFDLTQILDCRTKRRGDELSQEIIKKRRTDLDAEVKRLKAKQEKEEQDAREAVAKAEKEERQRRKRKELKAKMKATEYEARQGLTPEEFAAWKITFQKEQDEQEQKAEAKRVAKLKQDQEDQAAVSAAKFNQQQEAALTKDAEQKMLDEIEQGARDNEAAAKATKEAAKKKQREVADKKAKVHDRLVAEREAAKKLQDARKAKEEKKKADEEKKLKEEEKKREEDSKKAFEAARKAKEAAEQEFEKQRLANLAAQNDPNEVFEVLAPEEKVQFNDWIKVIVKGGQIDTDQFSDESRVLYDKWEPWYNGHFRKAGTSQPLDSHLQAIDNLNARAFVAGKTPLEFVEDLQLVNFKTVDSFIEQVIKIAEYHPARDPPLTPNGVFTNGLSARAVLEKTHSKVIAREAGFPSAKEMLAERSKLLPPKVLTKEPPPLKTGEDGKLHNIQRKKEWAAYNQFLLEQVGDYLADLEVVEEKVREHKAGKILPPQTQGSFGDGDIGFEF